MPATRTEGLAPGVEKAASLLVFLGTERSAAVLRHLHPDEVETITGAISRMPEVREEAVQSALADADAILTARRSLRSGGIDFARQTLRGAFGDTEADRLMHSLAESQAQNPFAFARQLDPIQLAPLLARQHVQTAALMLANLPAELSAETLRRLPPERRLEISLRVAKMGRDRRRIGQDTLREVALAISAETSNITQEAETQRVGGVDAIAAVLTRMHRSDEQSILAGIREKDAELAEEIERRMFTFDDLAQLDQLALAEIVKEIDVKTDLALALKRATQETKDAFFAVINERSREGLIQAIEYMGRKHIQEVEAAQQKILTKVRKMEEAGQISLGRNEDDAYV